MVFQNAMEGSWALRMIEEKRIQYKFESKSCVHVGYFARPISATHRRGANNLIFFCDRLLRVRKPRGIGITSLKSTGRPQFDR